MTTLKKSIFYRWFGIGSCPAKIRHALESEGIIVFDEGISGHFITKHVDGPHKRYRNRTEGFLGFLAITKTRLLCHTFGKRQINISTADPKLAELHVEHVDPDVLTISFESSQFRDGWNGEIAFRFHTGKAKEFVKALAEYQ